MSVIAIAMRRIEILARLFLWLEARRKNPPWRSSLDGGRLR
jgi:hypothetical protein